MSDAPADVSDRELRRTWFRGYRPEDVDRRLEEAAARFEEVQRECSRLTARVEDLKAEVQGHEELETLLRSTLVSAERAAQNMKTQALHESDLIVREAYAESRRVTREAAAEKHRLEEDMVSIRMQLRSALEALEAAQGEETVAPAAGQPAIVDALESGIRKVIS